MTKICCLFERYSDVMQEDIFCLFALKLTQINQFNDEIVPVKVWFSCQLKESSWKLGW